MVGLYIHIPFCHSICSYCDFCKMVASKDTIARYISCLEKEWELLSYSDCDISTIYIGGGTPSSLDDSMFYELLSFLSRKIDLSNIVEFTIEFNPEDLSDEKIHMLHEYHVNRVSIGVESFVPHIQRILRRRCSFEDINNKINKLNKVGISNISIDLMYGIESQTMEDVKTDLMYGTSLPIKHISCYSLQLEENTILHHLYDIGKYHRINEEIESNMYFMITDILEKKGFYNYETSNFCIPTYESKHNLIYWKDCSYIALGASGSSYFNNIRKKNPSKIFSYMEQVENKDIIYEDVHELSLEDQKEEFIMLGLRLACGINEKDYFLRFQQELRIDYPKIYELVKMGYLEYKDSCYIIVRKYRYVANSIIVQILE